MWWVVDIPESNGLLAPRNHGIVAKRTRVADSNGDAPLSVLSWEVFSWSTEAALTVISNWSPLA